MTNVALDFLDSADAVDVRLLIHHLLNLFLVLPVRGAINTKKEE